MADVQMKGITCCADCVYYSMKKHKCTRGYKEEGKATDHFYKDCPLPDVRPILRGRWIVTAEFTDCVYALCDQCKITQVFYHNKPLTNYCPNCGADMREVDDG